MMLDEFDKRLYQLEHRVSRLENPGFVHVEATPAMEMSTAMSHMADLFCGRTWSDEQIKVLREQQAQGLRGLTDEEQEKSRIEQEERRMRQAREMLGVNPLLPDSDQQIAKDEAIEAFKEHQERPEKHPSFMWRFLVWCGF